MITMDDFQSVKRRLEDFQSKADKASGALSQLKATLKKEFGVSTIKEAKRLFTKLLKEEHDALRAWNKSFTAFKKQWKHVLEE